MSRVLLVDDSKEIFTLVSRSISSITNMDWAETVSDATKLLSSNPYDLVLLDMELPDGNGLDLCAKIQETYPKLPIFFLTVQADLSEKVLGFSAGADDYITKPFLPLELKARVEAKLKKQVVLNEEADHHVWKEIEINKTSQEVKVKPESQSNYETVDLTSLEFKILAFLALRPNEVVSRDLILNSIWGKDVHIYPRSVDTHVSKLRKKLGECSTLIESIHGVGYKFKPSPKGV